ncbi:hypothetical protein [Marinobacter nauticus]|uniref:hypothetical protein n=1 Tax=Marinobacter nauticus TaxID=2743 RepID=UPI003512499A
MKDQLSSTEALLTRLKKELKGKPEFSSQVSDELDEMIEKIRSAHRNEISEAKKRALITDCLVSLGSIVKVLPEVIEFFRNLN